MREYGDAVAEVVLLIHMPGWEIDRLQRIVPIIERQARSQGWLDVRVLTESQIANIVGPSGNHDDPGAIERFRRVLGNEADAFTEVYFSHLVGGHAAQLCLRAFPQASRVTYGESMGLMEDKDYVLASITGAGWDESTQHLRRRPEPDATKAVLILPADQTGDCLQGKELFVVPRDLALQVIADFQITSPELGAYSRELLRQASGPKFLFIAANLSDIGIVSPEGERDLYVEMIESCAPSGASILIKAHPLSTFPIDILTAEKLRSRYDVHIVSPEFNRYPMELWSDLLRECEVISLSYCSISLEYLFEKPVHYPLNIDIIKKYIDERAWNRWRDGDEFFRQQRQMLKTWDRNGVLCSGRRISFAPTRAPALSQDIDGAERKNQQGVALVQAGRLSEAVEIFKEGLALAPAYGAIATNLGVLSWNSKNQTDAVTYFSLALLSEPDNRVAVLNLSHVLLSLGNRQAAKAVCFRYLQRHVEDTEMFGVWRSI
jgi:tetratricopeptide (TPR) repeat protein